MTSSRLYCCIREAVSTRLYLELLYNPYKKGDGITSNLI